MKARRVVAGRSTGTDANTAKDARHNCCNHLLEDLRTTRLLLLAEVEGEAGRGALASSVIEDNREVCSGGLAEWAVCKDIASFRQAEHVVVVGVACNRFSAVQQKAEKQQQQPNNQPTSKKKKKNKRKEQAW